MRYIRARYQKHVVFDEAERKDLAWLVAQGFGRNANDAVRKAVALARRVVEGSS